MIGKEEKAFGSCCICLYSYMISSHHVYGPFVDLVTPPPPT